LSQCEHEFNASKNVEKDKYHNQWYNWEAYCQKVQDMTATSFFDIHDFNIPSSILAGVHTGPNTEDLQVEDDTQSEDNGNNPSFPQHEDYDDDADKENVSLVNCKLSYGKVVGKCTDLVKTIQNDSAKMTKLFVLLEIMVKRY
jgi:hypothetical protein